MGWTTRPCILTSQGEQATGGAWGGKQMGVTGVWSPTGRPIIHPHTCQTREGACLPARQTRQTLPSPIPFFPSSFLSRPRDCDPAGWTYSYSYNPWYASTTRGWGEGSGRCAASAATPYVRNAGPPYRRVFRVMGRRVGSSGRNRGRKRHGGPVSIPPSICICSLLPTTTTRPGTPPRPRTRPYTLSVASYRQGSGFTSTRREMCFFVTSLCQRNAPRRRALNPLLPGLAGFGFPTPFQAACP